MIRVVFTLMGAQKLHCTSCEQWLGNTLRRLPGIEHAWASALTQRVVVTLDPTLVHPDQVQAKLEQFGYQATPQGGST